MTGPIGADSVTTQLESSLLIGGRWVAEVGNGERFSVINPATGDQLIELPNAGAGEVRTAIEAAARVQRPWARTTASNRAAILRRAFDLMLERADGLARVLTLEQGKPLAEAKAEVGYGASFASWFAGEAERIYGRTVPANDPDRRILVLREPVGVTGAITPWNFPIAMVVRKIAPALAAGCTVVLKPSDLTPLSALNVARILEEAGLPEGVLSVVCSRDPEPIGDQLLSDQRVKKITFTGSTEVGKHLLKGSADTVKRISLELGGNAPFIVFEDADLDAAVDGLMIAKMRNGGQSCIAANRIFVQRTVYDSFCAALVRRMATLKIGNGLDPDVTVGPLINKAAVDKVTRHVSDALANGAVLELGGRPPTGLFVEPTILGRVSDDMQVAQEETFGPITALTAFDDEEEVVRRANSDEYGLAAYYYTRDISRVFRLADDLEYGIQGVNDGFVSVAQAPFGGLKQSGLGREGGAEGIEEFIETKYLSLHL